MRAVAMRNLILFLALSCPCFGAIARVNVSAVCSKNVADTNAVTCNAPAPPIVGNTIVVGLAAGGGTLAVTDNATGGPNIYTLVKNSPVTPGSSTVYQYSATVARTNAGTFTISATTSAAQKLDLWFAQYSGVDATSVDVATQDTTGAGGVRHCSVTAAFLTTTNANDLIVATIMAFGATPLVPNAANATYTMSVEGAGVAGTSAGRVGLMDLIVSSVQTAVDVRFNGAAGGSSLCDLVAYKASTAAVATARHRVINQ
jgi:hypothetical protein